MEKYTGQAGDYPYTLRIQRSHKKGESKNVRILCEDILTLDIETTSFFYEQDKKPFLYEAGFDPEYWCGVYSGSLPYIWQFGINGKKYYGREFSDFKQVLDDLPEDMISIIWVHNLPFEWHHMDFLTWDKVFAKAPHKPIKASCKEYPNIQFRCTFSLENMSLAEWAKAVGSKKLIGYLVYNMMRTPLTDLDSKGMEYAAQDIEIMYLGLKQEVETYGSVHKIPLTSTGKIRRVVKDMLMVDNDYVNFIHSLVPENPYQYKTSMMVYAGGYCHGNRWKVNRTFINKDHKHGGHYDYTSSYPLEMVWSKVPCTTWAWYGKEIPDINTFKDHAYKMHLVFKKIRCELQNTYIQCSHASLTRAEVDNGRLLYADYCDMWLTELDYEVISKAYTWESVEVLEVWEAEKDYLPLKFVEYVLQLFHDKTALKGIDEGAYRRAKAFLNSLYGMCVTALLQATIEWDDAASDWKVKRITEDMITEHLDKLARYKDKRYFLNYDWGVWISNGARCRLWNDLIIPYDQHVIYSDTDSIFTDIFIDFTAYNELIDEKLKKVCDERGLDFNKTRPFNSKGKQSFLGHLTVEEEWTEFRTLGSKRYCERWASDGKLHLTVAGINKDAVSCLHDDIENFRNGCLFDKDEEDVHKLMHTYFDHQPDITFPDGYVSHQRRGVNLRPNGYKLTMDKSFDDILGEEASGIHNELFENHLKGVWFDDIDEIVDYALGRK